MFRTIMTSQKELTDKHGDFFLNYYFEKDNSFSFFILLLG